MTEWVMAHPWMAFFLLGLTLLVVDSVIANICEAVGRRKDGPLPKEPTPWPAHKTNREENKL